MTRRKQESDRKQLCFEPAEVQIGHLTVKIVFFEDWHEDRGFYDSKTHTIGINKNLSPEEQIEVLFHEIAHAWLWANGHSDRTLTEEEAVGIFGRVMAAFVVLNREYALAFLASRLFNE